MERDIRSSTQVMTKVILLVIFIQSACFMQMGSGEEMSVEGNMNLPGWDYSSFDMDSPSPDQCAQACLNDPLCKAFTYVNPSYQGSQARCWLKSGVSSKEPNECCVSGVKVENAIVNLQTVEGITVGGAQGSEQMTTSEDNELKPLVDLTGIWECTDGGLYYITQKGNIVAWFAKSRDESSKWAQVGWGTANYGTLNMEWMDVPLERRNANGALSIKYTNDMMTTLQSDSEYKQWTRYKGEFAIQLPGPALAEGYDPERKEEEET
jgi:hypothetical protein